MTDRGTRELSIQLAVSLAIAGEKAHTTIERAQAFAEFIDPASVRVSPSANVMTAADYTERLNSLSGRKE